MRRLLAVFALVAAALFAPATTAVAVPDPNTCTGYPEPRVFLESQDWWQAPGTEDFGHVHLGMCFPRTNLPDGAVNKVSGTVHFDFKVQLHENPGSLDFVRIHLLDGNGQNHQVVRINVGQTCGVDDCTFWVPVDLNTNVSTTDGYQNIRVAAIVNHPEHGGTKRFAGGAWPMYLANGDPVRDSIKPSRIAGASWYTGALYEQAELTSLLPYTVSGTWTPQVRLEKGAGGIDVTSSFASIDPSFHAVPEYEGQVVLNRVGPYKGPLAIDTTALTNGPHKLFLRSGAPCDGSAGNSCGRKPDGSSNDTATHYSIQVITFTVSNP